jgi:hypothetical protein
LETGFELIYSEQEPQINARRPFSMTLVYPVPQLKAFIGRPEKTLHFSRYHSALKAKPSEPREKVKS